MPTPTALSCTIITKDEADRIARCVRAAKTVADDVLVVDSGSTDETVAIAEREGARVLHRDWTGYGPQKRYAELQAAHDWILSLDADEVLSPELQAEIAALMADGPALGAYRLRIVGMIPGRDRPHLGSRSYNVVRLFDRRRATYSDSPIHDRVETGSLEIGQLKGLVHHYSFRSLAHLKEKLDAYATYQLDHVNKPLAILLLRLPFEYPLTFLKYLVFRGNITAGWIGVVISHLPAAARTRRIWALIGRKVSRASGAS